MKTLKPKIKTVDTRQYDTARWRKVRKWWLNRHPLCVMCEAQGRITMATVIDHIQPHNNNYELFWDSDNWQSLCASCHSGIKRMQENHGYSQAASLSGEPIDRNHPWNKKGNGT